MDNYTRPIQERIDWLFEHARRHSVEFSSPETWLAQKRYLAEHPTAISVLKCMDGRINLSLATDTPIGIIQPFRNLGGRFDPGWPHLGEVYSNHVGHVVDDGRRVLATVPYYEIGSDRARAELKSRFMCRFAAEVIRGEFPELAERMHVRAAVLDWRSRALESIAI